MMIIFSYNNGKIIYAAFESDTRWGNRNYSVIKMLDLNSGEEKKLVIIQNIFLLIFRMMVKPLLQLSLHPEQKSKLVLAFCRWKYTTHN
jgi:membrane-anchored glycerophosphoryl diester phosphodiesterase (GDPDase)